MSDLNINNIKNLNELYNTLGVKKAEDIYTPIASDTIADGGELEVTADTSSVNDALSIIAAQVKVAVTNSTRPSNNYVDIVEKLFADRKHKENENANKPKSTKGKQSLAEEYKATQTAFAKMLSKHDILPTRDNFSKMSPADREDYNNFAAACYMVYASNFHFNTAKSAIADALGNNNLTKYFSLIQAYAFYYITKELQDLSFPISSSQYDQYKDIANNNNINNLPGKYSTFLTNFDTIDNFLGNSDKDYADATKKKINEYLKMLAYVEGTPVGDTTKGTATNFSRKARNSKDTPFCLVSPGKSGFLKDKTGFRNDVGDYIHENADWQPPTWWGGLTSTQSIATQNIPQGITFSNTGNTGAVSAFSQIPAQPAASQPAAAPAATKTPAQPAASQPAAAPAATKTPAQPAASQPAAAPKVPAASAAPTTSTNPTIGQQAVAPKNQSQVYSPNDITKLLSEGNVNPIAVGIMNGLITTDTLNSRDLFLQALAAVLQSGINSDKSWQRETMWRGFITAEDINDALSKYSNQQAQSTQQPTTNQDNVFYNQNTLNQTQQTNQATSNNNQSITFDATNLNKQQTTQRPKLQPLNYPRKNVTPTVDDADLQEFNLTAADLAAIPNSQFSKDITKIILEYKDKTLSKAEAQKKLLDTCEIYLKEFGNQDNPNATTKTTSLLRELRKRIRKVDTKTEIPEYQQQSLEKKTLKDAYIDLGFSEKDFKDIKSKGLYDKISKLIKEYIDAYNSRVYDENLGILVDKNGSPVEDNELILMYSNLITDALQEKYNEIANDPRLANHKGIQDISSRLQRLLKKREQTVLPERLGIDHFTKYHPNIIPDDIEGVTLDPLSEFLKKQRKQAYQQYIQRTYPGAKLDNVASKLSKEDIKRAAEQLKNLIMNGGDKALTALENAIRSYKGISKDLSDKIAKLIKEKGLAALDEIFSILPPSYPWVFLAETEPDMLPYKSQQLLGLPNMSDPSKQQKLLGVEDFFGNSNIQNILRGLAQSLENCVNSATSEDVRTGLTNARNLFISELKNISLNEELRKSQNPNNVIALEVIKALNLVIGSIQMITPASSDGEILSQIQGYINNTITSIQQVLGINAAGYEQNINFNKNNLQQQHLPNNKQQLSELPSNEQNPLDIISVPEVYTALNNIDAAIEDAINVSKVQSSPTLLQVLTKLLEAWSTRKQHIITNRETSQRNYETTGTELIKLCNNLNITLRKLSEKGVKFKIQDDDYTTRSAEVQEFSQYNSADSFNRLLRQIIAVVNNCIDTINLAINIIPLKKQPSKNNKSNTQASFVKNMLFVKANLPITAAKITYNKWETSIVPKICKELYNSINNNIDYYISQRQLANTAGDTYYNTPTLPNDSAIKNMLVSEIKSALFKLAKQTYDQNWLIDYCKNNKIPYTQTDPYYYLAYKILTEKLTDVIKVHGPNYNAKRGKESEEDKKAFGNIKIKTIKDILNVLTNNEDATTLLHEYSASTVKQLQTVFNTSPIEQKNKYDTLLKYINTINFKQINWNEAATTINNILSKATTECPNYQYDIFSAIEKRILEGDYSATFKAKYPMGQLVTNRIPIQLLEFYKRKYNIKPEKSNKDESDFNEALKNPYPNNDTTVSRKSSTLPDFSLDTSERIKNLGVPRYLYEKLKTILKDKGTEALNSWLDEYEEEKHNRTQRFEVPYINSHTEEGNIKEEKDKDRLSAVFNREKYGIDKDSYYKYHPAFDPNTTQHAPTLNTSNFGKELIKDSEEYNEYVNVLARTSRNDLILILKKLRDENKRYFHTESTVRDIFNKLDSLLSKYNKADARNNTERADSIKYQLALLYKKTNNKDIADITIDDIMAYRQSLHNEMERGTIRRNNNTLKQEAVLTAIQKKEQNIDEEIEKNKQDLANATHPYAKYKDAQDTIHTTIQNIQNKPLQDILKDESLIKDKRYNDVNNTETDSRFNTLKDTYTLPSDMTNPNLLNSSLSDAERVFNEQNRDNTKTTDPDTTNILEALNKYVDENQEATDINYAKSNSSRYILPIKHPKPQPEGKKSNGNKPKEELREEQRVKNLKSPKETPEEVITNLPKRTSKDVYVEPGLQEGKIYESTPTVPTKDSKLATKRAFLLELCGQALDDFKTKNAKMIKNASSSQAIMLKVNIELKKILNNATRKFTLKEQALLNTWLLSAARKYIGL